MKKGKTEVFVKLVFVSNSSKPNMKKKMFEVPVIFLKTLLDY